MADVGIITDNGAPMLRFWTRDIGLPVEAVIEPAPGVLQHRLALRGAVLKINCIDKGLLPATGALGGIRTLLIDHPDCHTPEHWRDPDGNLVFVEPVDSTVGGFGVHLAVSDPTAAHRFYCTTLGFPALGGNGCDIAGTRLSWAWAPDVASGTRSIRAGYTYMTIQVMDVAAAHRHCRDNGATEVRAPSTAAFGTPSTVSFIADPDGNQIELSQRPDLVAASQNALLHTR